MGPEIGDRWPLTGGRYWEVQICSKITWAGFIGVVGTNLTVYIKFVYRFEFARCKIEFMNKIIRRYISK